MEKQDNQLQPGGRRCSKHNLMRAKLLREPGRGGQVAGDGGFRLAWQVLIQRELSLLADPDGQVRLTAF
jgi:hypothetical protein